MKFSRQEYWSGLPFPSPEDLPETWVSCIAGRLFPIWATREAQPFFPFPNNLSRVGILFLSWAQFSSVAQSCPTLCDPMNHSKPGLPVHHQLPEFTQTHIHRVNDAIQPSHPLSSPSPPAPKASQHQSLFLWVNSSHEVAKVLEFQLQLQRNPRADLL